jgi:transposase
VKDVQNIDFSSFPKEAQSLIQSLQASVEKVKGERDKAEHERNQYRKLYDLVVLELERLRRQIFGKKSERVANEQLVLQFMQIAETLKTLEESTDKAPTPNSARKTGNEKKRTPHGRQTLPEHLPVERIELPVPVEVAENPDAYKKVGEDVSETLERRPASLVRVQIVRPKFAKKEDEDAGIIASELPTKPIEKGIAGPGLISHVIVSKYLDHIPLNRMESIFARENIVLGRATLCGWIKQCAEPASVLYKAMFQDALNAHCIATDATGVLVQAEGKCHRGHFFVLIADRDHVLYFYKRHHDGDAIKDLLGNYKGHILADAHVVYDQLYRDTEDRIECGCYSHTRRYFYDAIGTAPDLAMKAIRLIGKLFEIERKIKDSPPEEKLKVRQAESRPITDEFFAWCDKEWPNAKEHEPIYNALRYARNQKHALLQFLEDGKIPIHNNGSELALRQQVIGRRNWLFLGSEDGGEWNCVFTSLIASARLHSIEPWAYLRDLLILLPDWPKSRVLELSPKFWKQTLKKTDARQRLAANPFYRITAVSSKTH